jgi:RimJ/RimL family protein N-acetyltransferase
MEPPDMDEAGLFACWLNDPEVVKYSEQRHKTHTEESQGDYWLSAATAAPNFVYSIYSPTVPIGSVAVRIDQPNNVANVGIMIGDKTQWGKGYGFEAWECVCNYLFIEKSIRKIEAGCMSLNAPMIRICTKYGMRHEAIVQDHFLVKGKPVSMHLYGSLGQR